MNKYVLNASQTWTPVGAIYNEGEQKVKKDNLKKIGLFDKEIRAYHEQGRIHIHDLESYWYTYNCLTLDWTGSFYSNYKQSRDEVLIVEIFSFLTNMLQELGNDQSGGMSFGNFDIEISDVLKMYNIVKLNDDEVKILRSQIKNLIKFCNFNKTRQGQVSYYVTFNVGLGTDYNSRTVTRLLIEEFSNSGINVYKPNIVFKVNDKINSVEGTINNDLFQLSTEVTAKKMIPTYLLTNAESNIKKDPYELSVVGCRSKIYDNKHGKSGAIGGFNISSTSINIPRIALESKDHNDFFAKLNYTLSLVKKQLIHRFSALTKMDFNTFNTWKKYSLYKLDIHNVDSIRDFLLNGTLAFGYIGLYEAAYILTGEETHVSDKANDFAYSILKFISAYVDKSNETEKYNFSLLSTAGELISGKFCKDDAKVHYNEFIHAKGYYTNSFHMKVNSGLSVEEKLQREGRFHTLSTGGSISYVEATGTYGPGPDNIIKAVSNAQKHGVHYLGFNFPIDICNNCYFSGVFDMCKNCGSSDIKRLRRVSGYIEDLSSFTKGKRNEEKERKENGFK